MRVSWRLMGAAAAKANRACLTAIALAVAALAPLAFLSPARGATSSSFASYAAGSLAASADAVFAIPDSYDGASDPERQSDIVRLDPNGSGRLFALVPGGAQATNVARSPGLGGFPAGHLYVLSNGLLDSPRTHRIHSVAPDGTVSLFSVLPETTSPNYGPTGLTFDTVGTFGHNMIVSDAEGRIFRVSAAGEVIFVVAFLAPAAGPVVAPLSFRPFGGHILLTSISSHGDAGPVPNKDIFAVSPERAIVPVVTSGLHGRRGLAVIPPRVCSLRSSGGAMFAAARVGQGGVLKFGVANFAGLGEAVLVHGAGGLTVLRSNGTTVTSHSFYANSWVGAVAFTDCPADKGPVATPPKVSIGDTSVSEGNAGTTPAIFTLTLDAPASEVVTVKFSTDDGSAIQGVDYTAANGEVVFAPGEASKSISVRVIGDTAMEPDETFFVGLVATAANVVRSRGVGTIVDDDERMSPNPDPGQELIAGVTGPGGSGNSAVPTNAVTNAPVQAPGPSQAMANAPVNAPVQAAVNAPAQAAANAPAQAQVQVVAQTQVQGQTAVQAQVGMMVERQREVQLERAGISGADAVPQEWLATERRPTLPPRAIAMAGAIVTTLMACAVVWASSLPATGASLASAPRELHRPSSRRRGED